MLFGMYVLFTTDEVQFMSTLEVHDTVANIKDAKIAKATTAPPAAGPPDAE